MCGCLLIVTGLSCLFFGWPWGAVIGAILLCAGLFASDAESRSE